MNTNENLDLVSNIWFGMLNGSSVSAQGNATEICEIELAYGEVDS